MSVTVGCDFNESPGCCGVVQIYGFSEESNYDYSRITCEADNKEKAFALLFKEITNNIKEYQPGNAAVAQIWFVQHRNYDEQWKDYYEAEPLRQLIETIPGVIHLGEYRNPNSGNKIKGYQWEIN